MNPGTVTWDVSILNVRLISCFGSHFFVLSQWQVNGLHVFFFNGVGLAEGVSNHNKGDEYQGHLVDSLW